MMLVRLSVTEVHWRIIANLGFKFRSHLIPRIAAAVLLAGAVLLAVLLAGESSRAMLASARLSCLVRPIMFTIIFYAYSYKYGIK